MLWVLVGLPLFLLLTCGGCMLIYLVLPLPPTDVLVLGVDARPGEGYVTRTDSVILVGIQPPAQISLLSIPRDVFISVPEYGLERINAVNVLGEMEQVGYGPELLKQSIALSFGVQVEHYVRLNFQAFEDLIDAVGGVTINVERAIVDDFYPTDDYNTQQVRFEVGEQHMDGATALIYARTRHSDDDYFRAERQQQVVEAFTRKLINPLTWPAVLSVLTRAVDTDLSPFDMLRIAPAVLAGAGQMERLVIDREYIRPIERGAAPDYEKLNPWIEAHFD
ncbi:MAG: hypothetical protein OHK0046_01040 [Anaerolineae bacterium]